MLRSIRPKRAVSLALARMIASSAAAGIAQVDRATAPAVERLALGLLPPERECEQGAAGDLGTDDEEGQRGAGELQHVFKHDGDEAGWKWSLERRVALKHGQAAADRLVSYKR
jgi:hypothetical protein